MGGGFGNRSEERDVSRLAYFGLFALQHRGQEAAGIAVSDRGHLTVLREMGLVAPVFDEPQLQGPPGAGGRVAGRGGVGLVAPVFGGQQLQALPGEVAIGHTRYSTTGANKWANAQPLIHHGRARTAAPRHNRTRVNAEGLRPELTGDGVKLESGLDSEVIAALICRDEAPLAEAVANAMAKL